MKDILITGGAGFIGSHLAKRFLASGHRVVIIDNLSTGSLANLSEHTGHDALHIYEGDAHDEGILDQVATNHSIDVLYHFAAMVGVERTQAKPDAVFKDLRGIQAVLEFAKNQQVPRMIYASSSEIYGEGGGESASALGSGYARCKRMGELLVAQGTQHSPIEATILRLFNIYGPEQRDDFVLPRFLKQALKGEPLTVYGDGKQTRSFLYIDDLIDAIYLIETGELFPGDAVNLGGHDPIEIGALAEKIIDISQTSSPIEFVAAPVFDWVHHRRPNLTKSKRVLNPKVSLEEGIQRCLESLEGLDSLESLEGVEGLDSAEGLQNLGSIASTPKIAQEQA